MRAAPASKPYCHNFPDFRLDVGDSGDEIIALKKALSRVLGEGYMQPANPKQNYYDEITAENVKELQSKNGIVTTGNVGSRTRSLLNRLVVCPSTPRTTQPTTQPKAEPTTQQAIKQHQQKRQLDLYEIVLFVEDICSLYPVHSGLLL